MEGECMNEYSCFDMIGPVMVGPSSSHTAGAVRLGRFARAIAQELPKKVEFLLHGSFGKTYKGHGTDLALLGGLLGMDTDDVRIRNSNQLAEESGLQYEFIATDLGEGYHANTARFVMTLADGSVKTVTGCSIGGGKVLITELDGFPVEIEGIYPTIVDTHLDQPGVIHKITGVLVNYQVNIAAMKVFRQERNSVAYMIIETDQDVPKQALFEIAAMEPVLEVKFVKSF